MFLTISRFNSSPPSATYMCQWIGSALVQIMAVSPIRRQAIIYSNAGLLSIRPLGTNFSGIFYQNTKFFIYENAPENIIC